MVNGESRFTRSYYALVNHGTAPASRAPPRPPHESSDLPVRRLLATVPGMHVWLVQVVPGDSGGKKLCWLQTSGIVTCITGTGYLVRTSSESVRTSTYSVQTGTGNLYQYRQVHTSTYWVCTKIMSCMLDTNRGTIQYQSTTAYMSRTHSIVSPRHITQNSINCNVFVNTVHTSMCQVRTLGK